MKTTTATLHGMTPAENASWMNKQRQLKSAGAALVELALQSIESRYELESDEFYTARQKALEIYRRQNKTAV